MNKKLNLLIMVFILSFVSTLHAANIVWVGDTDDNDADGIIDDIEWVEWLRELNHSVDHQPDYWLTIDSAKVDFLNNADLVIVSRNTDSGDHFAAGEPEMWNSVTTPMIMMTPYLPRDIRWNWINSGALQRNPGAPVWEAIDPEHPIFNGVTLDENNQVLALDESIGTGHTAHMDTLNVGTGIIIAQVPDTSMTGIVEWKPGVEFFSGGPIVEGPRLLFTAGTSEDGGPQGKFNLTLEGEQMFINSINYILGAPPLVKAFLPNPSNDQVDVARDVIFSWRAGPSADKHNVYFGTDLNDVNEASVDDSRGVLLSQNQDETTYDPPGLLEFEQKYYWRVDEVNDVEPNSPWKGDLWSFTTANFIVVEDFEDYNDYSPNEVWNTWIDGFGDPTNGSTAGYPDPDFIAGEHYVETDIVHSGSQSMPFFYDNNAGISEVTKTLTSLNDWTADDVVTLTLFYYGDAGNALEPMYIALNDNYVVTNDDERAVLSNEWTQWDILLQDFADQGINLTNINSISIGFGDKANPTPSGGTGRVFFDDIRLSRSLPADVEPEPESVDPGTNNLMVLYAMENNVQDGSGSGYNAAISGNPQYVPGPTGYEMALALDGIGDYATLPIGPLLASLTESTIATWVNWSGDNGAWQRIFDFGSDTTTNMFCTPNADGNALRFAITISGGGGEEQTTAPQIMPSGWHHIAVTIDPGSTTHTLYLDGKVVAQNTSAAITTGDLGVTTQNWLGRSQYPADPFFEGSLDEFRIYNRVLSTLEVLYLAGK